ncbi:MAG: glycine cleavage system protein H [Acidithiobacillales bacterium SG8_45]|jgi:glycine cleavage system H protein|nr:MAG: glycine cleavage system protein H [Acidithiobacillales bacterium SG8_45]
MSNIPGELKYSKSHEWVRINDDGSVTIGITEHAQDLMGDMVYVELPETGASLNQGDDCAVVESVKAASDVYAPIGGEILEVNDALADAPETINSDPYGEGWIFRMTPADGAEIDALMDANAYEELVASEA